MLDILWYCTSSLMLNISLIFCVWSEKDWCKRLIATNPKNHDVTEAAVHLALAVVTRGPQGSAGGAVCDLNVIQLINCFN